MKKLLPLIAVFMVMIIALVWFVSSVKQNSASDSIHANNPSTVLLPTVHQSAAKKWSKPLGTSQAQQAVPIEQEVSDALLEDIILGSNVAGDTYKKIVALLKRDEQAVLEFLAKREYPLDEVIPGDPRYEEVEMLARAFMEVYRDQPLSDVMHSFETLQNTGAFYSTVVAEALFATEGWENANMAYDWVMANPSEPASLRSGASIGGKLADFDKDMAWEKAVLLPEGDIREGAMAVVLGSLAASDLNKAEDLLNRMPASADLDRSIADIVSLKSDAGANPESLVELAIKPVSSQYRLTTLTQVFRKWASEDPDALVAWLDQEHNYEAEQLDEIHLIAKQSLRSVPVY